MAPTPTGTDGGVSTDDHAVVRRGIGQVLSAEFQNPTIVESTCARDTVEFVRSQAWDLLILDINLPDRSGLEALKEIKLLRPALPVLILSLFPEEQYARRALKAGASGYATKDTAPEELAAAVRSILKGRRYISPNLAERLADDLMTRQSGSPPQQESNHAQLSDREMENLQWIARGKRMTDIADQLALSVKTVSTYRSRILDKLRLKTTADLIRYALDNNLA